MGFGDARDCRWDVRRAQATVRGCAGLVELSQLHTSANNVPLHLMKGHRGSSAYLIIYTTHLLLYEVVVSLGACGGVADYFDDQNTIQTRLHENELISTLTARIWRKVSWPGALSSRFSYKSRNRHV